MGAELLLPQRLAFAATPSTLWTFPKHVVGHNSHCKVPFTFSIVYTPLLAFTQHRQKNSGIDMDSQDVGPPTPASRQESSTPRPALSIRLRPSNSAPSHPNVFEQHQAPQQKEQKLKAPPEFEASQPVKSRTQNSSDRSAPALPDLLEKAVEIYKQTETTCPLSPFESEDMAPEEIQPKSILRRTLSSSPKANNDNSPREASANKSPSTHKVQFTGILQRPGRTPPGLVPNTTNINKEEDRRPRTPIPAAVAIPTTNGSIAHGPPVGQSRVEPPQGLADPTDHRYFWKYFGREMDPSLYRITESKAMERMVEVQGLTQRYEPEDENEIQDVKEFMINAVRDNSRSEFLWKHRKAFDKDLGQLMDVKAHHTMRGNEDMIQAPPQFIDDADFFDGPGEASAVVDIHEIPLESLSLYDYPDWKTRDDWRTSRIVSATPGEIPAKTERKYEDCTREQLVWIEMMYCSVRKLGDVRLGSTEVKNMFREKFGCEIPKDWKGLATEIARDASRKMLKYRIGIMKA